MTSDRDSPSDPSPHKGRQLISEPLTPIGAGADTTSMARGEPGLPHGFEWRGESARIVRLLEKWKESSHEGDNTARDLYLRRHYYKMRMTDDRVWTVYFERQSQRGGHPKQRWFLYTIEEPQKSPADGSNQNQE